MPVPRVCGASLLLLRRVWHLGDRPKSKDREGKGAVGKASVPVTLDNPAAALALHAVVSYKIAVRVCVFVCAPLPPAQSHVVSPAPHAVRAEVG